LIHTTAPHFAVGHAYLRRHCGVV